MPPRNIEKCVFVTETDEKDELEAVVEQNQPAKQPPMKIVWRNVIWMVYLHAAALYGVYLMYYCKWQSWIWFALTYIMSGLGITAGAHRLWAHRSYKAKLPLRIVLAVWNTMAFQNDVIEWSRDHRVHHKYSETDADPHNASRGFFFSHVGWLLVRKHPEVKAKGKRVNIDDLLADPVLVFQRKVYLPAMIFTCFFFPSLVAWYFWSENWWTAFFTVGILRYTIVLNATWAVNSVAHMFGNKPYDREINPVETISVTLAAIGEGYHNYHHTFPQDYSASEFGWGRNFTTAFIDFCAWIGQAYGLKKISPEMVKRRMERTGDGSTGFGYFNPPKKLD